jgi:ATP-binding cassette, subfamily C, bacterial LapB
MTPPQLNTVQRDAWIGGFMLAAKRSGLNPSRERASMALSWAKSSKLDQTLMAMAETCGLEARVVNRKLSRLRQRDLPVLAITEDGVSCLITQENAQGVKVCGHADGEYFEEQVAAKTLEGLLLQPLLRLQPLTEAEDRRVEDYAPKGKRDWFFVTVLAAKGPMFELMLASFFCSLLAIASAIFSMQIWDRVIPARSIDTLWVLTIGVLLALVLTLVCAVRALRFQIISANALTINSPA